MEEGSLFRRMKQLFQGEEVGEDAREEATGLMKNIIRYFDKEAFDIMTHRKHIVGIDGNLLLEEVLQFMLSESYSRFPVYEENIDEIVGILNLREGMTAYLNPDLRGLPIKELKEFIRPVPFVPETKSIDTLFREMQAEKIHMAIVLDEYGQTSGLVTLEDILEEIVGNILDEYDEEETMIQKEEDGSLIAFGLMELEKLEEYISIVFEKEDYETINGFLIAQLDRIPSEDEGEKVVYQGYVFTILEIEDNIIQRVKIEKEEPEC